MWYLEMRKLDLVQIQIELNKQQAIIKKVKSLWLRSLLRKDYQRWDNRVLSGNLNCRKIISSPMMLAYKEAQWKKENLLKIQLEKFFVDHWSGMRLITCQRWHSPKKGKGNYCLFNVAVYHMDWHSIVCPKCKSPITNPDQLAKAAEVTGIPAGRLAKLANICTPEKDPNRKWGEL